MLLAVVVAFCVASHAVTSAATVPLPEKVYYDLEDAENLFEEHIELYQRKYDVEEYNKRFEIFQGNLKTINYLNAKFPRTVFKVTHFADLTREETKCYFGLKPRKHTVPIEYKQSEMHLDVQKMDAPDSFNWLDHGAVTPVKDQGQCASCYIFSAIGNIEGQYAIKHKQLVSLSEQQCLDCLSDTTCKGGLPEEVAMKLKNRAGCMNQKDYPYHAKDGEPCKEQADKVVAKITGFELLNCSNAEELKQKLHKIGPLMVGIDGEDFRNYGGGILEPDFCSFDPLDANHAVLLVGYGEDDKDKYWIIKNSWGEGYGESGYVRMLRGINACGVENQEYIGTVHVS